ncbi:MAG: hypothetical protein QGI60_03600 [archaeon]|jgi:hypothetical protein|nr:hypothetical protein [archaeon]
MKKTKNRAALLALFLLCIFISASAALSIKAERDEFFKGEEIVVSGNCNTGLEVYFLNAEREITRAQVECVDEQYSFSYQTSFLDPAGIWWAWAKEGTDKRKFQLKVNATRESQFYLITFLSPSEESYFREQDLNISVRITDAGQIVNNAKAYTWDSEGKKLEMLYFSEGVYLVNYRIPSNAKIEDWAIVVTAEREKFNETFGGERRINVSVEKAPIAINIIKPEFKNFEVDSTLEMEIALTYLSGQPVKDANVEMLFGEELLGMESQGNGTFTQSFVLEREDLGAKKISIIVVDSQDNDANTQFDIIVSDSIISNAITLIPIVSVLIILALIGIFVVKPILTEKEDIASLKKQKKRLETQLNKLQKDYFAWGRVSKEYYNGKNVELQAKLSDVKKKLKIR